MSEKIENLLARAKRNERESSISSATKICADEAAAERMFSTLRSKLFNIAEWNEHALFSSYELFDEAGQALPTDKLSVGIFVRISMKASGKYDWIKIINISDAPDEFVITVKPTFDPTAENPQKNSVSHFFTDASTNNFCLLKTRRKVALYVIGLNEKPNTDETSGAFETIRNAAVNIGTYLGVQKSEWEKFCHNFIESAYDK